MRLLKAVAAVAAATALALPASAGAAVQAVSSNWAGYAIVQQPHRFHQVTATWVEPAASCQPGHAAFSVFWVGLGGLLPGSQGLEQTGTEADCGASGRASYLAWYELLPAPPVYVRLHVRPRDVVTATVTVTGRKVAIKLVNHTRRVTVNRTLRMSSPDVSSAEWIAEAPAACAQLGCAVLPLANFGSVGFRAASATTVGGRPHPPAYPGWSLLQILLENSGAPDPFAASTPTVATPTALSRGSAFSVVVNQVSAAVHRPARQLLPTPR